MDSTAILETEFEPELFISPYMEIQKEIKTPKPKLNGKPKVSVSKTNTKTIKAPGSSKERVAPVSYTHLDVYKRQDGDKTVVGEKGISLSGGQKARISLARAVYSGADIYLLDDVLSAVDAHVGKKIIDNVLGRNGILASKTVILATNSVHVLHEAHNIYMLKNGTISESGDYDTVMERKSDLAQLLQEFGKTKKSQETETETETEIEEVSEQAHSSTKRREIDPVDVEEEIIEYVSESIDPGQVNTGGFRRGSLVSFGHEYTDDEEDDTARKTGKTEEKLGKGQVKRDAILSYLRAASYKYIIPVSYTHLDVYKRQS